MGKRVVDHSRGRNVYTTNDYDYDVTATDFTSQDVVYSTVGSYEHDDAYQREHQHYNKYYETDEYDSSKLFDHYNDEYDYTTSGVSNDDRDEGIIQQPVRREQLSSKQKYHNPDENLSSDEFKATRKFRARWTKPNYVNYNVNIEKNQSLQKEPKLKKRREYDSLINEEPEKDYKHNYESSKPKEKMYYKYKYKKMEDESVEENFNSEKPHSKGYKVLAFQDPRLKNVAAKGPPKIEETTQQSEVDTENHEYPVLAFKNAGKGKREMVYLPLLVMDEQSFKSKLKTRQNTKTVPGDNFQVYAANLPDQQNIFQRLSRIKTENENGANLKPQENITIPSDLMYDGSFLQSMINEAGLNETIVQEPLDGNHMIQRPPPPFSVEAKYPLTYQVDVDISPEVKKDSMKSGKAIISNTRQSEQNKERGNSQIISESITKKSMISRQSHDPLEDSYPVKKDYIKVSSSSHPRSNTQSNAVYQTSIELANEDLTEGNNRPSYPNSLAMAPSVLIDVERITQEIENSKNNQPAQSIIKKSPSQTSNLNNHKKLTSRQESLNADVTSITGKQNEKLSTVKEEDPKEIDQLPFLEHDSYIRPNNKNHNKSLNSQYVPKTSHTKLHKNKSESSLLKLSENQPIQVQEQFSSFTHEKENNLKKQSSESLKLFKSQVFNQELNEKGSETKVLKSSQDRRFSHSKNYENMKQQSKNSTHKIQSQVGGDSEYIQQEDLPIPLSEKRSRSSVASILRNSKGRTKSKDKTGNRSKNYEERYSQPKKDQESTSRNNANLTVNGKTGSKSTGLKKIFSRSSVASIPRNSRTKSKGKEDDYENSKHEELPTEYRESTSNRKSNTTGYKKTQSNLSKKDSKMDIDSSKKSTGIKRLFSRSRSKNEDTGNEAEPKSHSSLGILRRGKERHKSQVSVKKSTSNNAVDKNTKPTCENQLCVASYTVIVRECGNFFLGTNLYQRTMDILSLF